MIERRPETAGHVVNAGARNAPASRLASQAREGLAAVPTPELVIIQEIGLYAHLADIRCDGTDPDHVAEFGESLRDAVETITDASPNSRILVTTRAGRPAQNETLLTHEEAQEFAGGGPCDFFTPDGRWLPEQAAYLTGVIEAYEAEQSRVCAEYRQCADDGGAGSEFVLRREYYSNGDIHHLNANGQAAFAAHMWPVIEAVLDAN
jgi:hypothetical protein